MAEDLKGSHKDVFPDQCARVNGFEKHAAEQKRCCGKWPEVKPYPITSHCCGVDRNVYKQNTTAASNQCIELEQEVEKTQSDVVGPGNNEIQNSGTDLGDAADPNKAPHEHETTTHDFGSNPSDAIAAHEAFHNDNPDMDVMSDDHMGFHDEMRRALGRMG